MTDLRFIIHEHVPGADGSELENRLALLKARDFAAGMLAKATHPDAYNLAQLAHETAGKTVFADLTERELNDAVTLCRCCVQASLCADRLLGDAA
ncbi:hypothetical protein KK137_06405 [Croceibacterium sp. LX-88]|uniref:Uncharacterized protein n=1 Tax=Croceibacterium selenioxidans TaxID=2838833 RepID=A0ABS5W2I4_9SPHN|nr:hypothetical protein [Croceibacterium selenioxidans]MBT2133961.1 hypothetical protein [Croceibacterium selenioxidans]